VFAIKPFEIIFIIIYIYKLNHLICSSVHPPEYLLQQLADNIHALESA
jgi:hypothetical protein